MYDAIRLGRLVEKAIQYRESADAFVNEVKWLRDNYLLPHLKPGGYLIPKVQPTCSYFFWLVPVDGEDFCVWKECFGCSGATSNLEMISEAFLLGKAQYLCDFPASHKTKINTEVNDDFMQSTPAEIEDKIIRLEGANKKLDAWIECLSWLASGNAEVLYQPDFWYEIPRNNNSLRTYAFTKHIKDERCLFKQDPYASGGFDFITAVEDFEDCLLFQHGQKLGSVTPRGEK